MEAANGVPPSVVKSYIEAIILETYLEVLVCIRLASTPEFVVALRQRSLLPGERSCSQGVDEVPNKPGMCRGRRF